METLLTGLTSPLGLIVLALAGGLTLVIFSLTGERKKSSDPLAKLREQARPTEAGGRNRLSRREESNQLQKRLERYKAFLEPANEKEKSAAKLEMIQAGFHNRNAVRDYHAAKLILAISGLMLGLAFTLLSASDEPTSPIMLALSVLCPTLIGYYMPVYWVNKRREERQDQIASGFPDALDMLLICTEAGQSLDQSIARIAKELRAGYPALAEEFETVSHEVKAGKDRLEVLKDMGERCGNVDVRSFVTVLVQSATYGTSVSDALRVYAAEMRDKRVMLAEEKANVLPTKLTLGTMMFTVPPLLIILVGPSVHGMMELFSAGVVR